MDITKDNLIDKLGVTAPEVIGEEVPKTFDYIVMALISATILIDTIIVTKKN